jgi:hypothetical protein
MVADERAALVATEVIDVADLGIEPRRADVETRLVGLRVAVLPDETTVATDLRRQFHHVHPMVELRPATGKTGSRHRGV